MASKNEEKLSALVDGELDETDVHLLLDRLRDDPGLAERWSRYHLINDALRNNLPATVTPDFAERVWKDLEDEPTVVAPPRRPMRVPRFMKQAVGLALASSVTAVAILGVQQMEGPAGGESRPGPQLADAPDTRAYHRVDRMEPGPTGPRAVRSTVRPELQPYLVNHNEYAVSSGMPGVLPYARVVSQGEGR